MSEIPRFLSGIQPTGELHLGNYFGAIRQHLQNQVDGESYYFIANYHALTTARSPDQLRRHTFEAAATYLALGLDPKKAVLFRQSDVPEVCELTWLLLTVTGMGLLEKAVSYKDKVQKGLPRSSGLFTYPVLMAADILAYESTVVPVGQDQVQHVEMTRDIAGSFNALYGDVFVLPTYQLNETSKVPGLDGSKMSKSYNNTIPIFAEGKQLQKLVKQIKTDATPLEEPKDPNRCLVYQIYSLFATDEEQRDMAERYRKGGYGYGHAKKELLEKIDGTFGEARERYHHLHEHPSKVEEVLADGAARARAIADRVLCRAREACGLA